jgi:hypothetical protein
VIHGIRALHYIADMEHYLKHDQSPGKKQKQKIQVIPPRSGLERCKQHGLPVLVQTKHGERRREKLP